jgi:hypothetical protein
LAELNVDINDPIYAQNGGSKGKRLRTFLQTVDDGTAVRTLQALWDRRAQVLLRTAQADPVPNAQGRFLSVVEKLSGASYEPSGQTPLPASSKQLMAGLQGQLFDIRSMEPHKRGYAFESFLKRCFDVSGLEAREPFRNTGEQIDGSFHWDTKPISSKPSGCRPQSETGTFMPFMVNWRARRRGRGASSSAIAASPRKG